ncbi:hypothetical protein AAVH_24342 [Aphelenchoides avenae]|nr:hypothetical protein AAVH_24342 [Aphelenchus avenae]
MAAVARPAGLTPRRRPVCGFLRCAPRRTHSGACPTCAAVDRHETLAEGLRRSGRRSLDRFAGTRRHGGLSQARCWLLRESGAAMRAIYRPFLDALRAREVREGEGGKE